MNKIFYMGKEFIGFCMASINGVFLSGNLTSEQIGVVDMVDPKLNIDCWVGTSSTAAGTTTKVVTTKTGDWTKTADRYLVVRFTNATTTSTSLNVDSTGSTSAYYNGSRINSSNGAWAAGDVVIFQYSSSRYNRIMYSEDLPVDVKLAYNTMVLGWDDVLTS